MSFSNTKNDDDDDDDGDENSNNVGAIFWKTYVLVIVLNI